MGSVTYIQPDTRLSVTYASSQVVALTDGKKKQVSVTLWGFGVAVVELAPTNRAFIAKPRLLKGLRSTSLLFLLSPRRLGPASTVLLLSAYLRPLFIGRLSGMTRELEALE